MPSTRPTPSRHSRTVSLPSAPQTIVLIRRSRLAATGLLVLLACSDSKPTVPIAPPTPPVPAGDLTKINHLVVIYLENRSFDHLYGEFAGADGLSAAARSTQVDSGGVPYATLPQTSNSGVPATLPNAPFAIEQFIPAGTPTIDLVHSFYQQQQQINGGKMDKFVAISNAKGFTMGYYHTAGLPLAVEAKNYTLLDRVHHSAFGGSFVNHIYLVAAAPPPFPGAPSSIVAQLDASGRLVKDGAVTPDGYGVNTLFSVNTPRPASATAANLVPSLTIPTIGDRLSDKGLTWAWYSGGWNNAVAGTPEPSFQFHHQPFVYFARYADGTQARTDHLKDEQDFLAAAAAGTLPAVSFVKPIGAQNEHPGYTDLLTGERHAVELVNAVRNGPNWKDSAIIITYDENGGFWDHVAPPVRDKFGPGTRIPTIVVSPFARRGYVDHTMYETVSILALIERRWGLAALSARDAGAGDLTTAFDFAQVAP